MREIITPLLVTDLVQAKKIKADQIEGLEIITGKISRLSSQVAGIATSSAKTEGEEVEDVNLTVDGNAQFKGESIFQKLVTFVSHVIFRGDVTFLGRPTFNRDTGGFALITKDTDEVAVAFEKEYVQTPLVLASISLDTAEENFKDKPLEEQAKAQEELEKDMIRYGLKYFVTKRDKKGFVIKLSKKAPFDIPFNWHAISVKDAAMFRSKTTVIELTLTPVPSATPTQSPSPTPTTTPLEATPSATTE